MAKEENMDEEIKSEVLSWDPRDDLVRLGETVIRASMIAYVVIPPHGSVEVALQAHSTLTGELIRLKLSNTDADEARLYFSGDKVRTGHDG